MSQEVFFLKIQQIFKKTFEDCPTISLETSKNDIPTWDSITFLNLIVELEDTFQVEFEVEEIENIDSVKAIINILSQKK